MFSFFENLVDPFRGAPTGQPPAKLWPFLVQHLRPFRWVVFWVALTSILVALIETGLIFYAGHLIDLMSDAGPDHLWSRHGVELSLIALGVLILRPAMIGLNRLFLEQATVSNLPEQVRWQAHRHMLGQSMSFFQDDFAGRLSNRVMQLGGATEDAVVSFFEAIWYAIAYIIGAIILLAGLDPILAVPLLIWTVLYIVYVRYVTLRVAKASERFSEARSLVSGRVVDAYANIGTVKLFAAGQAEERYALSAMKRMRLRWQRFVRLMTEMVFGTNVLNGMVIVGLLAPAVWLWQHGALSIGDVAAASALALRLNGMTGWIMWVATRIFEQIGVIREGLQSVSVPHAITNAEDALDLTVSKGQIELRNVSHHYGRTEGGLDQINLTIPAGQKVGLVGRSGAGKSTLVNLLLRFHDAEQGDILIDDQNVVHVTQDSLRAQIGMVTQDNSLMHRSVRANIQYGRPDATEDQMIAAAHQAEAHEFIKTLEDPKGRRGYNAYVGERGVKLSGGQRQRIALARVILKNAPILVLDEATSALDSESETAIQDALQTVMQDKTVIAIAHRLSTIASMDRIIVLDEGQIVGDGTHAELLDQGGIYAELWAHQSGGFLS